MSRVRFYLDIYKGHACLKIQMEKLVNGWDRTLARPRSELMR